MSFECFDLVWSYDDDEIEKKIYAKRQHLSSYYQIQKLL